MIVAEFGRLIRIRNTSSYISSNSLTLEDAGVALLL